MCLPFSIFRQSQTPSWKYDLVELILGFLGKLGMVVKWLIMAKADGAYRQGVLAAYLLHKPLTNRFLGVNGEQPLR